MPNANSRSGRYLVTGLFATALQRAGYGARLDLSELGRVPSRRFRCLVLEGLLWRFDFETHPAPLLHVDVTLQLYTPEWQEAVWELEFPGDNAFPVWVGMGCKPGDMLACALREVEETAMREFQSDGFFQATGFGKSHLPPAPGSKAQTHDVVAESSWTGSETGEIHAIAHETGSVDSHENVPTAELYEAVFSGSAQSKKSTAKTKAPV